MWAALLSEKLEEKTASKWGRNSKVADEAVGINRGATFLDSSLGANSGQAREE